MIVFHSNQKHFNTKKNYIDLETSITNGPIIAPSPSHVASLFLFNTFPEGSPSSSRDLKTIFSVLPEANVLVRLRTGILPLGFTWKQIFLQLQEQGGER